MKLNFLAFILLLTTIVGCKEDDHQIVKDNQKDAQKKALIFENLNKGWNFSVPMLQPNVQIQLRDWAEWRLFLTEIQQKPKSSISAFQKKGKALAMKAEALNNNIPPAYDLPEIRSRIMTLVTKVKYMNQFLNLPEIQDKKVVALVPEINAELASLASQMNELTQKKNIQYEEGELEMIQSLDTASVIQNIPTPQNQAP